MLNKIQNNILNKTTACQKCSVYVYQNDGGDKQWIYESLFEKFNLYQILKILQWMKNV